jgi:crotonobetainyl-CoA:carnitine CoA-transferase CaiB-like acyl-CoA transferase
VKHIREITTDNQAKANEYVVPFDHPKLGNIIIPGYPMHFSQCRAGTRTTAPAIGEHTDEILKELGYSIEDIASLKQDKVIQ